LFDIQLGGHSAVSSSWRPNGEGEYEINDKRLMKGRFDKEGFLQGIIGG
jgi:hypothetical protein